MFSGAHLGLCICAAVERSCLGLHRSGRDTAVRLGDQQAASFPGRPRVGFGHAEPEITTRSLIGAQHTADVMSFISVCTQHEYQYQLLAHSVRKHLSGKLIK